MGMQLDTVQLYDRFQAPINPENIEQRQEGRYWYATIRTGPELLTQYRLATHRFQAPALDPVAWVLEVSVDGIDWKQVHNCELAPRDIPVSRGQLSQHFFQHLETLDSANLAFRLGFLCELLANAVSFSWLLAGTIWLSESTDTCVDTAPLLWYSCYIMVLGTWSFFGSASLILIMGAVASALGGFNTRSSGS